ncbi:MAG: ribose-phosphate diphosphokinase, partial [Clostridia bacterium]|nr:ribose-phosphate diphosphokinase [Clostridia bacterium]
ADMIETAGADRVLTMDLHASQIQGFFDIPVDNLMGITVLIPHFLRKFGKSNPDLVCVSPDLGSVSRVRTFAEKLDTPIAIIDKRRQKANVSEVMNIIGDIKDKEVLIIDDMIDTAGTLCNAAKALVEIGGAKAVYACATHGVLSGPAIERLENSVIKEVYILDTIELPEHKKCEKIKQLSISDLFTEAIKRIYEGNSVSSLF